MCERWSNQRPELDIEISVLVLDIPLVHPAVPLFGLLYIQSFRLLVSRLQMSISNIEESIRIGRIESYNFYTRRSL
jgi:hypothetical protein